MTALLLSSLLVYGLSTRSSLPRKFAADSNCLPFVIMLQRNECYGKTLLTL